MAFPGQADATAFPGHAGRALTLLGWRFVARSGWPDGTDDSALGGNWT
jgi:hypothetical protein